MASSPVLFKYLGFSSNVSKSTIIFSTLLGSASGTDFTVKSRATEGCFVIVCSVVDPRTADPLIVRKRRRFMV